MLAFTTLAEDVVVLSVAVGDTLVRMAWAGPLLTVAGVVTASVVIGAVGTAA
jgi:hypothetical protein